MPPVRYTYSDPYLSLWQSAAAEVQRRHKAVQLRMADATAKAAAIRPTPNLMDPVDRIGVSSPLRQPPSFTTAVAAPAKLRAERMDTASVFSTVGDCSSTAAKFLWAEITGDHAAAAKYAAELKDSTCDPGWAECLAVYLEFKASGGDFPYRANQNVLVDLGTKTKIAIIGDWGTGQDLAINLLQQVKSLNPDLLIHLGDIYYSGTQNETQENFLDICRTLFGSSFPLYTLCGNHDMYSGGDAYYALLDQIGQQASYFCLFNADWQFLAMDTGHNDNNPFTVATNMTSLMATEVPWHINKIQQAGNKKTVLLSHHQLFSPFGSVGSISGAPYAYNPNLYDSFKSVLSQVTAWFWGHEHTLAVYDPYPPLQLQRGRCVGCSAVPVFKDQQSYTPASGLTTPGSAALPTWNKSAVLGNNGADYNHAFALMTLNGSSATVDYYQVPILQTAAKLFSEQF